MKSIRRYNRIELTVLQLPFFKGRIANLHLRIGGTGLFCQVVKIDFIVFSEPKSATIEKTVI
jgi:hypothetical protein